MVAAVKALAALLQAREADLALRRRRRDRAALDSFLCAVEALAVNLLVAAHLDPLQRPLAVPRDGNALWRGDRYAHACYGKGFLDALDLLSHPEVGLITDLSRGYSYKGGASAPSTVQATAAFLARFSSEAVTWQDFRRETHPEVLVLKAPKAKGAESAERIEYRDTALTQRMRREVQAVNRRLSSAPFWFVDDAGPLGLDRTGEPLDPLQRTVWRGFNNGRWTEGGRLWSGAWESMRRTDRFRLLRIGTALHPEGERVANVDFRSLNPVLCYALDGLPVPDGDLYDVLGGEQHRAGIKIVLSAMLFATSRFTQMPRAAQGHFPAGTRTKDVVAAIERHHAPIAGRFWCGYGHRLANVESAILLAALDNLGRQGVTALPLHDSVLVARSEAERAKAALETAFSLYLPDFYLPDHRAALSIDYGEKYQ